MTAEHACPNCGVQVALTLTLCLACRAAGWSEGQHHLAGDELSLYLELRRGERPKAPHGWWLGEEGLYRGAALLRWHVQRERGATTREAVIEVALLRTLEQARLFGWFNNRDHSLSVYDAFQLAFPELELRPWELPGQVPRGYWEAGGDEARAEALHWWLARLGLSAQEMLARLETRAHGVERLLREAGLGDLAHDRGLRALLHLVDPSIPAEPPVSARQRVRDEATLECPHCGRRLRSLVPHLAQVHSELSTEEREALLVEHDVRRDQARWRKIGLAIPMTWWPADDPGVALALHDERDGLLLLLTPDAQAQRRLHRNGRWWELRMPRLVQAAVVGAPVERVEDGVRVGPLGEEGAAAVRHWLGGRATPE